MTLGCRRGVCGEKEVSMMSRSGTGGQPGDGDTGEQDGTQEDAGTCRVWG